MLRYVLAIFVALVLLAAVQPWLTRIGLGRLPGDVHFTWRGRVWNLPFTSTLLLSALFSVIARWL